MKSKRRISTLASISIAMMSAFADNPDYYNRAEQAFSEGDYESAAKLYQAEYVINGTNVEMKIKLCLDCIADKETAKKAAEARDIERAKEFYGYVLERNPSDIIANDFIQSHLIPEWQFDCWIISLGNNEFLAVQKSINGKMTYENALAKAKADSLGGFSDWRLPIGDEMEIISHNSKANIEGYFWCLDQSAHASSDSKLVNGRVSTVRLMSHHKAYNTRTDEQIDIVDEWDCVTNRKLPVSVYEFAFVKVRRYKGDGNETPNQSVKSKRVYKGAVDATLKVETPVSRSSYCK